MKPLLRDRSATATERRVDMRLPPTAQIEPACRYTVQPNPVCATARQPWRRLRYDLVANPRTGRGVYVGGRAIFERLSRSAVCYWIRRVATTCFSDVVLRWSACRYSLR